MAYQVLARKYRPQVFEEVIRQTHITQTLSNALVSGRLAHAILFAGPRGTGKTTVARILAKCINCEAGPTAIPCNKCRSCKEIKNSNATDVFEIDGASNNKVEHIRELRENARYMPAHSPYKIYIVDEVHMLSDAAFNALLKILEEPPDHVMFFFATTEPTKIPITILSRCQRHDFRRVEIDALIEHMALICRKEEIEINEEGLSLIAREADGSVRDALSLLDHIMACAVDNIDTRTILDVLGGVDRRDLFSVSEAVLQGKTGAVLEIIDSCYRRGQHMTKLFSEIISHFRNLLVVKMGGSADTLADIPRHEIEAIRKQVADIPATYLNQILDVLFKEEATIKYATQPKLALEMAFLRILQIKPALSLETLIEKLDLLRHEFDKGGAAAHISDPVYPQPATDDNESAAPSDERQASVNETNENRETQAEAVESEPPGQEEAAGEATPDQTERTSEDHWQCILKTISETQPSLGACLSSGCIKGIQDDQIEIEMPSNQFHMNWVSKDKNRKILEKVCRRHFNRKMEILITGQEAQPAESGHINKKETQHLKQEALNHPMVEAAMKLFQGKIIEVKIL